MSRRRFTRRHVMASTGAAAAMIGLGMQVSLAEEKFPAFDQLPSSPEPPDPLKMFDGTPVKTADDWWNKRRPELVRLIEHYMYGKAPPKPDHITATPKFQDDNALGGKAVLSEISLEFGPQNKCQFNLLLALPKTKPAGAKVPVFAGLNFGGNHTVLADKRIELARGWQYPNRKGVVNNKATEESRGSEIDVWCVESLIDRGYALATVYDGDIDSDTPEFSDGIHRHYYGEGQSNPGENEWGTIAAWAWGLSRVIDYLTTRGEIDDKRIAAIGHSRLGKTALWAGALDQRIAIVCPHQSGTGGAAMSRANDQETVARINKSFPHWFADSFVPFGDHEDKIPFDQHCVMALCAPRPIFDTEGIKDTWANYDNAFKSLQGADPVYKLLGKRGLKAGRPIEENESFSSDNFGELMQYRRDEKHVLNIGYWTRILDFADRWYHERA